MGNSGSSKKKVLIIGAGPSGIIAVKEFTANSDAFEVVCMEQQAVVGGIWNYTEATTKADHPTGSKYTALYKSLISTLPKQLHGYSDMDLPANLPSFVHHSDIKDYLWNYAKTHNLHKFIKFNTRVTSVKPKTMIGGEDVWEVESVNVLSKKTATSQCNIVIVCNGNYFKAYFPRLKGIGDFKGKCLHSQDYRDPEEFRNKRVLLIGGGPSAVGVSIDVSKSATKVWMSHECSARMNISEKIEQVGRVVELMKKDVVVEKFREGKKNKEGKGRRRSSRNSTKGRRDSSSDGTSDGSSSEEEDDLNVDLSEKRESIKSEKKEVRSDSIGKEEEEAEEKKKERKISDAVSVKSSKEASKQDGETLKLESVDVIIFCTGFSYSFPFLGADCGVAVVARETVAPLYKDLICLGRQNIAFVGLSSYGTNMLFECQAKFLRAFYEGKFKIPRYGRKLLKMVEKDEEKKKMNGVDIIHRPLRIPFYQWQYIKDLATMAGFKGPSEKYEKLFRDVDEERKKSFTEYQKIEYVLAPDGFYVQKEIKP